MKWIAASLAIALVSIGVISTACTQAGPAPAPTAVPPAPTKAAEPAKPLEATKAPAVPTKAPEATKALEPTKAPQSTAVPTKTTDYPAKGKPITLIVPWAAGGTTDIPARLLAMLLEKELGATISVVNKAGAGSQVGFTEVALAKPDGYTLGYTSVSSTLTVYLDPERKPAFGRKDMQPVAQQIKIPGVLVVRADSPYQGVKGLVDEAKAKPGTIKVATSGFMSASHLYLAELQRLAATDLALVHFDGAAPELAALLGGHVDAMVVHVGPSTVDSVRSGQTRILGVMDKTESQSLPGVKTFEAQGYKVYGSTSNGIFAPGGTPKEIVNLLSVAIGKVMQTEEHKKKIDEIGQTQYYQTAEQFTAFFDEEEARVRALVELAKKQQ